MKVGILTFHDGINHGGFLQAFSTYSFLKENGVEVEIINYKNRKHFLNEYKCFLCVKNPIRLISNLSKIIKFKKAQKAMRLGSFSLDIDKVASDYDVIVVGSDIVWNYEWEFLGKDLAYFGYGLNTKRLVSYAPSFGSIDSTEKDIPSYISEGLMKFSNISVRDENSKAIVYKSVGRIAEVVLDPAFLFDTTGLEKTINIKEDYILVYAYSLRATEIDELKEYAAKNKLKIVAVGYSQTWADLNVPALGPFEWLGYFKNAQFILSGTFHGTIYALKYKKVFVTSNNVNISSKTKTILEKIGLSERLIEGRGMSSLFDTKINYTDVDLILSELIEKSSLYLMRSINGN